MRASLAPFTSTSARPALTAEVNDVHSALNPTRVARVVRPRSAPALAHAIRQAAADGLPVALSGGRHAMGGQQFLTGGVQLDMRGMARVLDFDRERGLLEVEAGACWPEVIRYLREAQAEAPRPWAIRQKQTGADRLSLGGAVSANIHGRGLAMRPFIADIEALTLVDADGALRCLSRTREPELFGLVVGGYGLLGAIATVTLRLERRATLERVVELALVDEVVERLESRARAGFRFGDFQFAVDERSPDFLRRGILSAYRPVERPAPASARQRRLTEADWKGLMWLAHVDKTRAFDRYAAHYLATSGQLYDSDLHQLSTYIDDYHVALDRRLGAPCRGSEVISELYVPRPRLADFMAQAARDLPGLGADVVYGTVRLIERDRESFLAWAREPWACVIFNLHTDHSATGVARTARAFRHLTTLAAERGGSYYLTYHRWATRAQLLRCHPRLPDFLARKAAYDPDGRFQSDWYRHTLALLEGDA